MTRRISLVSKLSALSIAIVFSLSGCGEPSTVASDKSASPEAPKTTSNPKVWDQQYAKQFATSLQVNYRTVTNIPSEACEADAKEDERCFIAEIEFTLPQDMPLANWNIYFSQMRPVQSVLLGDFDIERVQGDLHRISPSSKFNGFKANQTQTLRFRGEIWQLSEIDAMPNYYFVAKDEQGNELQPEVIASTQLVINNETGLEERPYVDAFTDAKRQYRRSGTDNLTWATADVLYQDNSDITLQSDSSRASLLPTPYFQKLLDKGDINLAGGINIDTDTLSKLGIEKAQVDAALARLDILGVGISATGIKVGFKPLRQSDVLSQDKLSQSGSYQLAIQSEPLPSIEISTNDAAGASYALSSLASLLNADMTVKSMLIADAPRYDYRGMHIDVSRNFHSKQLVLDLIDQMAAYKLNKLHLHMGDDEGWRLEIDGLPELTDIGSQRCHDLTETRCILPQLGSGPFEDTKVNGFYTKQDYIDIVRYADARQIQVIPSMDMPGHSRAAVKAMEARYNAFMAKGDEAAAKEYLLYDSKDTTEYSSVQYYNDNTLNVCMESTYHFVDKVITEIAALHKQAGQPLTVYHIGADETAGAWLESPICHDFVANNDYGVTDIAQVGPYFIERVASMLTDKGIQVAGWSDGMSHTRVEKMPANSSSYGWDVVSHHGYQRIHAQINQGWDVILSNPEVLYFDFPYEADPKEHGYYWATRALNTKHIHSFMPDNLAANAEQWLDIEANPFVADDRITKDEKGQITHKPLDKNRKAKGIQGQIWSETIRSDEQVEYMIFPRLLMLAEKAWHKPSWEVPYQYEGALYSQESGYFTLEMRQAQATAWNNIANHIGHKALAKLDKANIAYRIPTVGAKIVEGKLYANIAFPGLNIEYKELGKPNAQWQVYQEGVRVTGSVEIRAIAADGKRKGRSLLVN